MKQKEKNNLNPKIKESSPGKSSIFNKITKKNQNFTFAGKARLSESQKDIHVNLVNKLYFNFQRRKVLM